MHSAGKQFRELIASSKPLLTIVGVMNPYYALLAKKAASKAIYLSGAGIANSYGFADLGVVSLTEVIEEARKITSTVDLPLLVDADTGWGSVLTIERIVKELVKIGAAGMHIEDQKFPKRCGHAPHKQLVTTEVMIDRIKAATDARVDSNFVIMARTDAIAVEGIDIAIQRIQKYIAAGADMIFAEAALSLTDYKKIVECCKQIPVLANITEFGKTPLYTSTELAQAGVKMMLFPLTAFRVMSKACFDVYQTINGKGTQQTLIDKMQTREELYDVIEYNKQIEKLKL